MKIMKWMGIIVGLIGLILSGTLFGLKMNEDKPNKAPSPVIDVQSIEKSLK